MKKYKLKTIFNFFNNHFKYITKYPITSNYHPSPQSQPPTPNINHNNQ